MADGAFVSETHAARAVFLAADTHSKVAVVFACTHCSVSAFRWDGGALVPDGDALEAAGAESCNRPLAVMPPGPGQRTSYLVVGTCDESNLRIIALPYRRLVHTHTLEGMEVVGLAADPSGTALAVWSTRTQSVHTLPWPLPGMPPLQ
jgi:hypothetical protein